MSDVTVSVIMAVYNSEDYLPTAVESILSQGLRRFELLLVDDGSRDRSGAICDQFAAQDERVIALHKENGGMCHARNYALEHARGEYVTFVDNDDTMLPGFLADNYRLAHAHDADCIRFGRWRETQDAQGGVLHRSEAVPHEFALVEHEDFGARYAELRYDTEGVWTGLYRRSMIDRGSLLFDESLRHVDQPDMEDDGDDAPARETAEHPEKTVNPSISHESVKR